MVNEKEQAGRAQKIVVIVGSTQEQEQKGCASLAESVLRFWGKGGEQVLEDNKTAARAIIDAAMVDAARCIAGLMQKPGRNAIAQLSAAKDILERGGLQALRQVSLAGEDGTTLKITVTGIEPTKENT